MAIAKFNAAPFLAAVITDASQATVVANKLMTYIQYAEQIGKAWGISGSGKLSLVETMLVNDLKMIDDNLATKVANLWPKLSNVIATLIWIFNTIGWMFEAAAPIISAAAPQAVPAIAAIDIAYKAASAVTGAVGQLNVSATLAAAQAAATGVQPNNGA